MTKEQLIAWQKRMDLSVEQLAELLEIHPVSISRWRHGDRKIPKLLTLALEALEARLVKKKPAPK